MSIPPQPTTSTTLDIYVNQNATFKMSFSLTDSASGTPIDITSWSFSGSVATFSDATPITYFTMSVISPSSSSVQMELTPSQTELLTSSYYYYDVIAANAAPVPPEVYRLLQGKVKVNLGITVASTSSL